MDSLTGYNLLRIDPNGWIETMENQNQLFGELQRNRLRHRRTDLGVQVLFALILGLDAGETGPGQRHLQSPDTLFQLC